MKYVNHYLIFFPRFTYFCSTFTQLDNDITNNMQWQLGDQLKLSHCFGCNETKTFTSIK